MREGQYILKNLVLISAAIVIGATVRGGQLVADPESERPMEAEVTADSPGAGWPAAGTASP
jgi:hypothetical protein